MSRHFKLNCAVRVLVVSAMFSGLGLTAYAKSPNTPGLQAEITVGGGGGGVPYPYCAGDVVTQTPNKFSCRVDVTPEPIDDIASETNEPVYGLIVLIGPCGPNDYWNGRTTKTTKQMGGRTYETTTCRHLD
jgi:hypothetical protein